MDENRKNELLKSKLEDNLNQAKLGVQDFEVALECAKIALVWAKRSFDDYCCEKAHMVLTPGEWATYYKRKEYLAEEEEKVSEAESKLGRARRRFFQTESELQEFLDNPKS